MAKDSRFAEIYRQELKKNKGIFGSLASTGGARAKEALDLRQYLLPQMGVSGAIAQRVFGKSFKYGGGAGVRNVGGAGTSSISDKVVSEKLTRIDANGKIAAKNSIVLPAMARDMNLMRMNMQKMVKLSGGTPANKADMFFKRASEREGIYESQFKKSSDSGLTPTTPSSESGGIMSSILGFLKMPLLDMFSGLVGALIKGGLITAVIVGVGSLINNMINNKEFRDSVFNTVDGLMKSVFGEDAWKNLAIGIAAAGAAFYALTNPLGSLSKTVSLISNGLVGLVSFMVKHPLIFGVLAGAATLAHAADRVSSIPEDTTPLTNKEMAESQQSAASGGFKSAAVLAGQKRKSQLDEQKLVDIDLELSKLKKQEEGINAAPTTTKSIGDLGLIRAKMKNLEAKKSKLIINKNLKDQDDRELARTPTQISTKSETSPVKVDSNKSDEKFNYVVDFFKSKGWSDEQSKGIAGNLSVESGNFSDDVISGKRRGDGGKAIGVAQWHPDRQSIFEQHMGKPLVGSSLQEQLEFVNWELNNTEKKAGNNLRSAKTIEEAATIVDKQYERSSGQHLEQRIAAAGGTYTPSLTAASTKSVTTPQTGESSFSDTIVTAIAGLLQVSQDTNKQIQAVAAASSKGSESSSAMIESPYDREAFDSLFRYHADIHSSSA